MKKFQLVFTLLIISLSPLLSQLSFEPSVQINRKSSEVAVADVDQDGHVDILITNSEQRWYAGPDFTTYHVVGYSDGGPYGARVADVTGDGWPDFVTSDGTRVENDMPGNLYLYINPGANGDPTLEWQRIVIYNGQVRHQNDIRIVDMDGDGLLDVIERTWSNERVVVAMQNPDITDWTVRTFDTGETGNPEGISAGDIDGDGDNEIVLSGVYWDNPGGWRTGAYTEHLVDSEFIQQEVKSEVLDIDNDGDNDIYMGSCEGGYIYLAWYENLGPDGSGGTILQKHLIKDNNGKYHMVDWIDIDFDGDLDLATGKSFGDNGATIFYNENNGSSWTESVYDPAGNLYTGVVADLDADGDYDVVGPVSFFGFVKYYINDTPGNPPAAPTNSTANLINGLDINVTWQDNAIDEGSFQIERLENNNWSIINTSVSNSTNYTDSNTTPQTPYRYRIRAVNAAGPSEWDSTEIIQTWPQADTVYMAPTSGNYVDPQIISLMTDDPVDEIRYTINGSQPDENSILYNAPFLLSNSASVQAIALGTNMINSVPSSSTYNIAINGNFPPNADAGPDQSYNDLSTFILDGSGSTDLDDAPSSLTYQWSKISGPSGNLQNSNVDIASFTPNTDGVFSFELMVSDEIASDTDTLIIIVTNLDSDLVAYWPMDESEGPIIKELVDAKDGVPNVNVAYHPYDGKIAGALQFDGVSTRVESPSINVIGTEMTISFWMNASDFNNVEGRMLSKASGINSTEHEWMVSQISGSGLRFRLKTSDGGTSTLATGNGQIPLNEWIFITARYNGTSMQLFKNAVLIASAGKTGDISQAIIPVALGNQPTSAGDRPFSGFLDEVKIYDRALSDTEILDLYNDQCPKYLLIKDLTLTQDRSFKAKNLIELQNVIVPPSYNLDLRSQSIIVGTDTFLDGPSMLEIDNNVSCN